MKSEEFRELQPKIASWECCGHVLLKSPANAGWPESGEQTLRTGGGSGKRSLLSLKSSTLSVADIITIFRGLPFCNKDDSFVCCTIFQV